MGLVGNETIKARAIETLRKYGICSRGPLAVLSVRFCALNSYLD